MPPHPTTRPGLLRIPGPDLTSLAICFAPLSNRDHFAPEGWPLHAFAKSATFAGWWEFDLDTLTLANGTYEYEFLMNGTTVQPDPYATALTRFGGYRGLFTISSGICVKPSFAWDDEFPAGITLPNNNQIVIYEMPIKWMSSDQVENPLAELGSFDEIIFEHLNDLVALGINCIELLPVEDSPQTLNWGYGTRFFFAPDYDIGSAIDAKFFIKACHQRGIRVFLDVVMNMFAPECPLAQLAPGWFYQQSSPSRQDWGQVLFRFDTPAYDSYYAAREFLCEMAEYWVSDYHVDGYRIDDFADINNWDFVREFHDRATAMSHTLFPNKPFLVVAEDSNRRFAATDQKVVDAIWNFGYRDEIRLLLQNYIGTVYGQPSRSQRVQHLISTQGVWNGLPQQFDPGFSDLACSVPYITSHDVADAPRFLNIILGPMLQAAGLGDTSVDSVRNAVDTADDSSNQALKDTVAAATKRIFGGFAILLTSVGVPMFLAGEEFGDVHDTSYTDVNSKQQDPVQWNRAQLSANSQLQTSVAAVIHLRTSHPALQRDEVDFFYFHPQFDNDNSPRVFAYCRSAGQPLGFSGQVVIIANMGPDSFPIYNIPAWPWTNAALTETGYANTPPTYNPMTGTLTIALEPFGVRVFHI